MQCNIHFPSYFTTLSYFGIFSITLDPKHNICCIFPPLPLLLDLLQYPFLLLAPAPALPTFFLTTTSTNSNCTSNTFTSCTCTTTTWTTSTLALVLLAAQLHSVHFSRRALRSRLDHLLLLMLLVFGSSSTTSKNYCCSTSGQ